MKEQDGPLAQRPSGFQPGLWGGNILTVKVTRLIRSLRDWIRSKGWPASEALGGFVVNRGCTPRKQQEGVYPGRAWGGGVQHLCGVTYQLGLLTLK